MTDQERAVMQQALEALEWHLERGVWGSDTEGVASALRAALAQQQPEPVQEPLVWEPVVRDRPWPYLTALTQREYDALHADLRWNYKKITPPKAEPVQEPASKMTAGRAAYFMERFKREEKLLGPNEQAALDFVISMLEAALAQQPEPAQETVAKVELMTTGGNAGLATRIVEIEDHLRERLRPGQLLYTTPPQRKPVAWDGRCMLGHCNSPAGCENSGECRAIERKVRGK